MAKQEIQQFQYTLQVEEHKEEILIVHYKYSPGDPGFAYYSNGDPGEPPTGAEVDIVDIFGTNRELGDKDYELIEEAIIDHEESKDLWN